MINDRLTEKAKSALNYAAESALELGQNYVGTEHLLIGLVRENDSVAGKILEANNVTDDVVIEKIGNLIGVGEPITGISPEPTPRTKRVIQSSYIEARRLGHSYIGTEHLLIATLRESESIAVKILLEMGVAPQKLYNEILGLLNENPGNADEGEPQEARPERGGKGGERGNEEKECSRKLSPARQARRLSGKR